MTLMIPIICKEINSPLGRKNIALRGEIGSQSIISSNLHANSVKKTSLFVEGKKAFSRIQKHNKCKIRKW